MNEHAERPNCPVCDEEIRQLEQRVAETEGLERAEALMNLADFAFFDSRYELVLAAVSACKDLLPQGEMPRLDADCERKTSCAFAELKRFDEALEHAHTAREMYSKLNDHHGVGICLSIEGRAALELGRSDEGIKLLTQAAKKINGLGNLEAGSQCLLEVGIELSKRHDRPPRAIRHLDTAREGFATAGFAEKVAECVMEAGLLLALETKTEPEALERLLHAALIFGACGAALSMALCKNEAARILGLHGRPQDAVDLLKEAWPVLAKLGIAEAVAYCDMNWGFALEELGRPKQAATKFRSALKTFRKVGPDGEDEAQICELHLDLINSELSENEKSEGLAPVIPIRVTKSPRLRQ